MSVDTHLAFDSPRVHIGLDFDGVLCDIHGYATKHIQENHAPDFTRNDIEWDGSIPNTDLTMGDIMWEFAGDPDVLTETNPVPGAIKHANWLANHPFADPIIVTHRPPEIHDNIEKWLARHGFPDIELPSNIPDNKTNADTSFDVLIDDYHKHVLDAVNDGSHGIHFTGAWESTTLNHPDTYSVSSWTQLRELLETSLKQLE
ncbi:5' nucleotidase, NT5C type [Salinibaculum rarum]|uniref:5' nucleotidase, NT5C type n=1 Tax=Salinibaculum rarum TaxID=3058903 RepID=UPI00265E789C|nr:hypothetical protein [Salinibaculum sp. KK48]